MRHSDSRVNGTIRRHGKRTAAIVDRLTFAGQIIETSTVSYRLAHARRRQNAQKTASSPASPSKPGPSPRKDRDAGAPGAPRAR